MKYFLLLINCFLLSTYSYAQYYNKEQLDAMFFSDWNKPEYVIANTAEKEDYLNNTEKEAFYYLNLARMNPPLFAETYVKHYFINTKEFSVPYMFFERRESLIAELKALSPLHAVYPDKKLFEVAECFAIQGGKKGITGHDRSSTTCNMNYNAECCSYGEKNGLEVIMSLLIDFGRGNESLGHRKTCLSDYDLLGAAYRPHKTAGTNAVLDFGYDETKARIDYLEIGDKYDGYFKDREKHGKGTYFWHNGDKYQGTWRNGKQNGFGVFYWNNGDSYEGEWLENQMDGGGTFLWSNGDKYEGDWHKNEMHGKGALYSNDGERYDGEWKNSNQHGIGTFYWKNGDRYEGEWKDGKRNGIGTFYWHNGDKYVGGWKNSKMHGKGTYYWSNGEQHEGEWENDQMK